MKVMVMVMVMVGVRACLYCFSIRIIFMGDARVSFV